MEKINVAELLKDCPKGMELDCTMYDNLYFDSLNADYYSTINCYTLIDGIKTSINFTKYGTFNNHIGAKCVIFPKGKTTWEGFIPPYKFKDGDIIACDTEKGAQLFIFKENIYNYDYVQCYMMLDCGGEIDFEIGDYYVERFATEEEKVKLFDAIKANGYKWNAETKTLEKLIKPIFKAGNKVRNKTNHNISFTITSIEEDSYICGTKAAFRFDNQDDYELVPNKFDITTLKPFDKVLVRDTNIGEWRGHFFSHYDNNSDRPYICIGFEGINEYKQCIPYEENKYLLGKTDDCSDYYKTWINEENKFD